MQTYHIHINGIVQGVGFRPLVYKLANEMQLNGWVKNGNDGVNIVFNANEQDANLFFNKIRASAPKHASITSAKLKKTKPHTFSNFSIIVQDDNAEKQALLSPDMALCARCKAELHDPNNRRYRYPFITCTDCGPRYSILMDLPYERHSTAMQPFEMCRSCNAEYNSVSERRFFSQTNSCPDCGITLSLHEDPSSIVSNNTEAVLADIKKFLQRGQILGVKGIGGYLLLCDANSAAAIRMLRERKARPRKPFAVLYRDLDAVKGDFQVGEGEKKLLTSSQAPIVLLYPNKDADRQLQIKGIAPGLTRVGVMLPCSPLLELIATDFGKPLIATSANISGSPILYQDEDALANLFHIADKVVSYNRQIIIPQDDSVVQLSRYRQRAVILRRSRGYAPAFLAYKPKTSKVILSTGAFLKGGFTLSVNGNIFVSQFLGSGESYQSQQMYKRTLEHWLNMYNVKPDVIIADKHPGYFSHQYAFELARQFAVSVKLVQHHQAHFAAVLAENNLLDCQRPILGVVWDGTGLGNDGNLWGGEFFNYHQKQMQRTCYFDYFPVIAGDKQALEPRIAALCAIDQALADGDFLEGKFTPREWNNYRVLAKSARLFTSSVGRLFDAVACLLGLCDRQSFEGEAAMYLQALAEDYVNKNGFDVQGPYLHASRTYGPIPTAILMRRIIEDIKSGVEKSYIAAKFHYSLVCIVGAIAERSGVNCICFSGGVFQNTLLTDWMEQEYAGRYDLFFHKDLSPNDEHISFGQMVYDDHAITTGQQHRAENKLLLSTLAPVDYSGDKLTR